MQPPAANWHSSSGTKYHELDLDLIPTFFRLLIRAGELNRYRSSFKSERRDALEAAPAGQEHPATQDAPKWMSSAGCRCFSDVFDARKVPRKLRPDSPAGHPFRNPPAHSIAAVARNLRVWLILMPIRNLGIVLGGVREPVKRWSQDTSFDFAACR